jgi:hypothetical protein
MMQKLDFRSNHKKIVNVFPEYSSTLELVKSYYQNTVTFLVFIRNHTFLP